MSFKLTSEIIKLSYSTVWDSAKLEWTLFNVFQADEPETCLCGHHPILELCEIQNKRNGHRVVVGNCCVKKFIGLPSDKIFLALKRVRKDSSKSLNMEAIEHAFRRNWINKWERDFYIAVMRLRNLTPKQSAKKLEVNERLLGKMKRS